MKVTSRYSTNTSFVSEFFNKVQLLPARTRAVFYFLGAIFYRVTYKGLGPIDLLAYLYPIMLNHLKVTRTFTTKNNLFYEYHKCSVDYSRFSKDLAFWIVLRPKFL